jgi:hypothetical protein
MIDEARRKHDAALLVDGKESLAAQPVVIAVLAEPKLLGATIFRYRIQDRLCIVRRLHAVLAAVAVVGELMQRTVAELQRVEVAIGGTSSGRAVRIAGRQHFVEYRHRLDVRGDEWNAGVLRTHNDGFHLRDRAAPPSAALA